MFQSLRRLVSRFDLRHSFAMVMLVYICILVDAFEFQRGRFSIEVIKLSVDVHCFVSSPYALQSVGASECVCWCGARVCVFVCMCTYLSTLTCPPLLCLSSGPIPSSSPF